MRHCDVVCDVLVCDDAFIDCLTHGSDNSRLILFLLSDSAKRHGVVCVAEELRVVFFLRVDEDFCFCLGEFAEANHSLTRGDFVTIGFSNLDCTKRQVVTVESKKSWEVDEHSLCGFRT